MRKDNLARGSFVARSVIPVAVSWGSIAAMFAAGSIQIVVGTRVQTPVTTPSGQPVQVVNDIVAAAGKAVVVEGETNSLLTFSLSGKSESRILNTGPGGAMLANPVQMTVDDRGRILVLDSQNPKVARFSLNAPAPALDGIVKLRGLTAVSGICSLDGKTFIAGATLPIARSQIVHVLAADGSVASSFGAAFGGPGEANRLVFGASRLSCLPQARLVVVASKSYPELRAYDPSGALRWKQSLPDYHQLSFTENEPGSVIYTYPPDNMYDQTVAIFSPATDVIAVQVGRRVARQADASLKNLRTLLFSAADGHALGMQTDLPHIRSASADRLFAIERPGSFSILGFSTRER